MMRGGAAPWAPPSDIVKGLVGCSATIIVERLDFGSILFGTLRVSFRRQVPVAGRFVADFLAPSVRLVIEVDGGSHLGLERADAPAKPGSVSMGCVPRASGQLRGSS